MPSDPETVSSKAEFVEFVRWLRESGAAEDENPTTDRFLDALAAWVEDSAQVGEPSWRSFAVILAAAATYE
jgi:hypothetical protein